MRARTSVLLWPPYLGLLALVALLASALWRIPPVDVAHAQATPDDFNPSVNGVSFALALQPDGRILAGGDFRFVGGQTRNRIARINPDGGLDPAFDPNANNLSATVVVQPDGKILVAGAFSVIGGQQRAGLARLNTAVAARQELTVSADGTTVTWTRGGASPELAWVTFEFARDGEPFTPLGFGARSSGGWQLAGLSLPDGQSYRLRARGIYEGSLVETVLRVESSLEPTPTTGPTSTPGPTPPSRVQIYLPLVAR
ncbi:delta-60 repeat domain-containing protein [Candidatus Gracilibacteria bacterium]|nr:delta-60 repeat domain-containing protein [Candidatus Gracilibacteria bacterium]